MGFTKLKPLAEPPRSGCLNCGSKPAKLPMNWLLIFYGGCSLLKNGKTVWAMPFGHGEEEYEKKPWTLLKLENMAKKDPNNDYRLSISTPLWGGEWQRQGVKEWVAVKKDMGFA